MGYKFHDRTLARMAAIADRYRSSMLIDSIGNFAYGTVLTAPSPATSGLSVTLNSGQGALFPSSGSFDVLFWPAGASPTIGNAEIARATSIATDTITLSARAQYGTSPRTVVVGDQVSQPVDARLLSAVMSKQTLTPTAGATPSINTGVAGQFQETVAHITGITTNITNMSTNLTGTPNEGDKLKVTLLQTVSPTTVAAGSTGGLINNIAAWANPGAGILDVASITALAANLVGASSALAQVATTQGSAIIQYTGTAAGQITGCTFISGSVSSAGAAVATGGTVTPLIAVTSWGSKFDTTTTLPYWIPANTRVTANFEWNSDASTWRCLGFTPGPAVVSQDLGPNDTATLTSTALQTVFNPYLTPGNWIIRGVIQFNGGSTASPGTQFSAAIVGGTAVWTGQGTAGNPHRGGYKNQTTSAAQNKISVPVEDYITVTAAGTVQISASIQTGGTGTVVISAQDTAGLVGLTGIASYVSCYPA